MLPPHLPFRIKPARPTLSPKRPVDSRKDADDSAVKAPRRAIRFARISTAPKLKVLTRFS